MTPTVAADAGRARMVGAMSTRLRVAVTFLALALLVVIWRPLVFDSVDADVAAEMWLMRDYVPEIAALDRRGILEILRAEMATRARFVLGDQAVRDLLITEFRIQ